METWLSLKNDESVQRDFYLASSAVALVSAFTRNKRLQEFAKAASRRPAIAIKLIEDLKEVVSKPHPNPEVHRDDEAGIAAAAYVLSRSANTDVLAKSLQRAIGDEIGGYLLLPGIWEVLSRLPKPHATPISSAEYHTVATVGGEINILQALQPNREANVTIDRLCLR